MDHREPAESAKALSGEIRKIKAANLKRLRITSGMTQKELGEKINVKTEPQSYIANLEAGRQVMSDERIADLAVALGVNWREFYIEE